MNKIWKSVVALGLTVCMLAGCGQTADKGDSSSEDKETVKDDQSSSEENLEDESRYPDYLNLDSARPIIKDGEEITLTAIICSDGDISSADDLWWWRFVEEKLNINMEVEVVSVAAQEESKSLLLASGELPDMIFGMGITKTDVVQYGVEEGMFLPVSDWVDEELTPNLVDVFADFPDEIKGSTAPDGKVYCIPNLNTVTGQSYDQFGVETCFLYTPFLEAVGLDASPATLDDFVDMLRAFKKLDPAEFGVDEIYPIMNIGDGIENYLMTAFGWVGAYDAYTPVLDGAENEVTVPCMQEKYGDYIRLMNTLYTEGLLHPDYYTLEDETARAYAAEKSVGLFGGETPQLAYGDDYMDYFVGAAPLSSEWCETPVSGRGDTYSDGFIYISADTEYPEVCMRLLDYMCSPEGSQYCSFGPETGSEDLMGLIGGWSINDAGTWIVYNYTDGYDSEYEYRKDKISVSKDINTTGPYRQEYMKEFGYTPATDVNREDPVTGYRGLLKDVQKDYLVTRLTTAFMSEEQNASYTDLSTVIGEYVDSETAKFVVGQRPLDELDDFMEELKAMGGEEYLELCKEIYANY